MHYLVLSINAGNSLRVGCSKSLNQSIVPKILNIQKHPRGPSAIKAYLLEEGAVANTPCISIHWQRWEDESCGSVCIVFRLDQAATLPRLVIQYCPWPCTLPHDIYASNAGHRRIGRGRPPKLLSSAIGIHHKLLQRNNITDKSMQMGTIIIFFTIIILSDIK